MVKNQEIQIWIAECKTAKERDKIAERSIKIEGCQILFTGINDEGKYVVIKSLTGKAITTPAVEFYGYKQFPKGPHTERLVNFKLTVVVNIETAR